jgi:hypothetical protein
LQHGHTGSNRKHDYSGQPARTHQSGIGAIGDLSDLRGFRLSIIRLPAIETLPDKAPGR